MSDKASPASVAELNDVKAQLEATLTRFKLVNQSASEGLWDMVYPADGNLVSETPFWWSDKMRELLGIKTRATSPTRWAAGPRRCIRPTCSQRSTASPKTSTRKTV